MLNPSHFEREVFPGPAPAEASTLTHLGLALDLARGAFDLACEDMAGEDDLGAAELAFMRAYRAFGDEVSRLTGMDADAVLRRLS